MMNLNVMKCHYIYFVLTIILTFYASVTTSTSSPINVSLGFLTPTDKSLGPLSKLGHEFESAFKLAIDKVNANSKDIWIRSDFYDSIQDETSNPELACKHAAKYFHENLKFVGIVGGYSSKCSAVVQEELRSLDSLLSQISYRSPSVSFLDKTLYSRFFRTTSNNKKQAQVIVDVIKHFRWNQASLIHTDDRYYGKELSDEIVSKSTLAGIEIKERVKFSSGDSLLKIDQILQVIKTSGTRVNLLVAQGNDVYSVFKQIKEKGMYGDGWVWLCTDGAAGLFLADDKIVNMTADGIITIAPEMFSGRQLVQIIVSWYNTGSKEKYPGRVWTEQEDPTVSAYVGQIYRAVSVYHNMLSQMAKAGNITGETSGSAIRGMLLRKLQEMNDRSHEVKTSLGSPLYFDQKTDDRPRFAILNYMGSNGDYKKVGTWDETRSMKLELPAGSITWPGGSSQTPTDKGRPGKALFRIGFVAPLDPALGTLATYGRELESAFKVAVDVINNDRSYQIELDGIVKDEGLNGIASCHKTAEEMDQLNLVAVVGAYRSECSMKIHDVLGTSSKKTPIVSYASSSKLLSNKTAYKYFFRVVPSNDHESDILKQIVRKYGFKEVSIIHSNEMGSKEIAEDFKALVKADGVTLTIDEEFQQNSHASKLRKNVEKVRQTGSRVILVAAMQNDASTLLQIVRELKMAGKGWIWLGSDGASTSHFQKDSAVAKSMEGMLGVNPRHGDGALYLKMISSWMQKKKFQYPGIVHGSPPGDSSLPYTAHVFDAVNGIATALSDLVSRKLISHKSSTLTVRDMLYQKLKTYNSPDNGYLSATGMAAKMYFDAHQDGPISYDLVNLQRSKWKVIGSYDGPAKSIQFSTDPLFPGGKTIPVVGAGKLRYHVVAFVPKNQRLGALSELGEIWESALKAAISWVNKNDTLTVGFDLTIFDSGVPSENCSELAKLLPTNVNIVIGPARSECTAKLYDKVHRRGVPVLTYASTSSVLSKKTMYPNLFRLCPSDSYQASALTDLIEKYLWDKVGIVASKGIYGEELSADIENSLKLKAVKVTTSQHFTAGASRMTDEVTMLQAAGSAVNLIIANPHDAIQIFQEASELGMVGKGWTWLGSDGAISTLFTRASNLERAMQGMVGFRPKMGSGPLFESVYNEWKLTSSDANKDISYIAQIFDSILLPAFTLHKLHQSKVITPKVSKIVASRYLLQKLKTLQSLTESFDSTTGKKLYFDAHQDVVPSYDLVNLNGNDWVTVGSYEGRQLDITSSVVWPGGTVSIPPSNQPKSPKAPNKDDSGGGGSGGGGGGGTSKGLIVLAVVFSIFGLLVIIFMIYIVQRVRHRHLYMQSDLNQGGVFSVLYGHTVNRPGVNLLQQTPTNGHLKNDSKSDLMIPRHV